MQDQQTSQASYVNLPLVLDCVKGGLTAREISKRARYTTDEVDTTLHVLQLWGHVEPGGLRIDGSQGVFGSYWKLTKSGEEYLRRVRDSNNGPAAIALRISDLGQAEGEHDYEITVGLRG